MELFVLQLPALLGVTQGKGGRLSVEEYFLLKQGCGSHSPLLPLKPWGGGRTLYEYSALASTTFYLIPILPCAL